jgi:hypothetical protein
VFSDGCAEQFKSRHTAYEMTYLCKTPGVKIEEEYIHTFAPTSQFKCCCDSAGNDDKVEIRRLEVSGQVRATNAWEVCCALRDHMPPPLNGGTNAMSDRFHIHRRFQRYVAREDKLTLEQRCSPDIVLITPSDGTKEGREMPGIRHIYQFKANKYNIGREICYRTLTC